MAGSRTAQDMACRKRIKSHIPPSIVALEILSSSPSTTVCYLSPVQSCLKCQQAFRRHHSTLSGPLHGAPFPISVERYLYPKSAAELDSVVFATYHQKVQCQGLFLRDRRSASCSESRLLRDKSRDLGIGSMLQCMLVPWPDAVRPALNGKIQNAQLIRHHHGTSYLRFALQLAVSGIFEVAMSVDNIRVLIAVAADAIPQTWSSIPLLEGAKMSLTVHLEPVLVIFKSRFAIRSKRQPKGYPDPSP